MTNTTDNHSNFKTKIKKAWMKYRRSKTKKKKFFDIYDESKPPKEIHDRLYSQLLYVYTDDVGKNLSNKIKLKNIFFYVVMSIFMLTLASGVLLLFKLLSWLQSAEHIALSESIVSVLGVAIPALSTMVVSLNKIPEIITKYLFNVQEEKYMKQIIKNLQDYDKEVFGKECDINSRIDLNRSNSQNQDDSLGEFGGSISLEIDSANNHMESN